VSKHEFSSDGVEHVVALQDAGDHRVDAVVTAGATREELRFEAHALGAGRWLVRVGDEVHDVRVDRGAGDAVRVRFDDATVTLERLDPFREATRGGRQGGGVRRVTSPIPGRVLDVLVAAGDQVTQGQPVVIVEAMKMANELRAPIAGRVTRVDAVKGAAVDAGAPLVVVEG
jgi:biotin carboxyl carrier protein